MDRLTISLFVAIVILGAGDRNKNAEKRMRVTVPPESTGSYKIPDIDDIEEIKAECHTSTFIFGGVYPAVPPFSVPKKNWKKILSFFANPQVDVRPDIHQEIGLLRIYSKKGRVWSIPYYFTGDHRPFMFAVNGIRCRDGNSEFNIDAGLKFDVIIRDSYERKTGHIVSKPIKR